MLKLHNLLLLVLFSASPAMAIDTFSPLPNSAAVDYLRLIFGGLVDFVLLGQSWSEPGLIGAFMGVFGLGAYFLGMLYFIFGILKGMIDSGETGRFLGNAKSQVKTPVRMVIGTTCLFPAKNGFSLIQIMVMWVALQGVGLGDKSMVVIMDYFKTNQYILSPVLPDSRNLAASIFKSQVCTAALNKGFEEAGLSERVATRAKDTDYSVDWFSQNVPVTEIQWGIPGEGSPVCGGFTWKRQTVGDNDSRMITNAVMAAHSAAISDLLSATRGPAEVLVNSGIRPSDSLIQELANRYNATMRAAAAQAVQQTNEKAMDQFVNQASDGGFFYAGTWIGHIGRWNDAVQQAINSLPQLRPLDIATRFDDVSSRTVRDYLIQVDAMARNSQDTLAQAYENRSGLPEPDGPEAFADFLSKTFMGAARITTEQAAGGTLSHMTQMRALGDNLLWAAQSSLLAVAGASGLAGAKAAEWTVGLGFSLPDALAAAGGTITMLIVSMLGLGLMLSVYIPLIPAMVWTMAVLNWLLSVVEAVIAAPLFAAAHISPYGEEEIGTAGEGYRMLASLAIKPMLMVIAVFVAIGLCNAMAGVVNDTFMPMVAGAQSGSVVGIVKFVGIVSVYVLLMMGLTHACFALVHWLPDRVMLWLGRSVAGLGGSERIEGEVRGGMSTVGQNLQTTGLSAARDVSKQNKTSDGAQESQQQGARPPSFTNRETL
ncbi:DotA/TraY family protein [Aeromonas caviae]|uniref:DotA/TraY family protein n=1 Tax=Aeromonas caviae TaxID=648 RepID=UPI0029D7BAD0|nr:DotA/TraY family protein [Aeromonas caviae]MDX7786338.1 DotA/TraY family protein [Aeromonas caviae]